MNVMHPKSRIRLLTCLLALSMTTTAMISCGEEPADDLTPTDSATAAETTVETAEQETILISDLPDMDWDGRVFNVLGWEGDRPQFVNFEIFAEKETGDVVNDAIFRRNSKIEETYHVKIAQELADYPASELQKTVNAGEHRYDLAFLLLDEIGVAAQNGSFIDMKDVKHIDFSRPWWSTYANDSVSLCGKLYFTTSDFCLRDKSRTYIMVYNINMVGEYDIPDPVQTVRDGDWTMELMTQYVKQVSQDLDGDGKMGEMDKYGLGMDSYNAFAAFTFAQDNRLVSIDGEGKPYISADTERMVDSIDRALALTCDKNYAIFCNDFIGKSSADPWWVAYNAFCENRELFMVTFVHELEDLSSAADCNYGVLPFPKYDKAQENYITSPDLYAMMFGIPATTADSEFAGFMLEALSAGSMNTSLHAYYEVACKTKYADNPDTAEMLDLIFDNIYFEPAMIYHNTMLFDLIATDAPQAKANRFASMFEKKSNAAQKSLDKVVSALTELEH